MHIPIYCSIGIIISLLLLIIYWCELCWWYIFMYVCMFTCFQFEKLTKQHIIIDFYDSFHRASPMNSTYLFVTIFSAFCVVYVYWMSQRMHFCERKKNEKIFCCVLLVGLTFCRGMTDSHIRLSTEMICLSRNLCPFSNKKKFHFIDFWA